MPLAGSGFDGPRSPPNTKNTSHVPCKFFKSGQCQAGKACPFLHSTDDTTVDTPCKYFAKGNCKFGAKCMLAHILPNGRRVNHPYPNIGGPPNIGGGAERALLYPQDPPLAHPQMPQQAIPQDPFSASGMALPSDYPVSPPYLPRQPYNQIPYIDTGFASRPESQYGSSPDGNNRLPLASPSATGHLSVLDAPMPASFDSQGISMMARYGPIAASMPSKVFIESPPSSLPRKIAQPPDTTFRNLHDSSFAKDLSATNRGPELGSSPSVGSGDEGSHPVNNRKSFQRMAPPQPNIMSRSLPRSAMPMTDDWESEDLLFGNEEDLVPPSLHELLTPQERMRRVSRTEQDRAGAREAFMGLGTTSRAEPSPGKFGSPAGMGVSPSRYGALFARQREEEAAASVYANGPSPFGHVGSPLRSSSLQPRQQSSMSTTKRHPSNDSGLQQSPSINDGHHPSQTSSMSALSQQFSQTRLSSSSNGDTDLQHPKTNGSTNAQHPQPPSSYSSVLANSLNSKNSSSSSKTLTPPTALHPPAAAQRPLTGPQARIQEEEKLASEGGVFSMETEETLGRKSQDSGVGGGGGGRRGVWNQNSAKRR